MSTTRYRSTCGGQTGLKFDEAVLQGLGTDRGLLVPEVAPSFPAGAPEKWRGLSFEELAYEIMSLYVGPDDVPADSLRDIIRRSYGTFRDPDVTPVVPITDGMYSLELFHGPTFAFKDVALQFLGNLFEHLLQQRPGAKITSSAPPLATLDPLPSMGFEARLASSASSCTRTGARLARKSCR